jgi:nucleotide-binding universal stress UspA family protein
VSHVSIAGLPKADAHTIVVAVDGSLGSDAALEWAIAEAVATGRRILLAYANPLSQSAVMAPLTLIGFDDPGGDAAEMLQRRHLRCREAGVPATTARLEGSPADTLVSAAEHAAMLVVGARGHRQVSSLVLGSVSEACAHRARCPVVIIKSSGSPETASSIRRVRGESAWTSPG